MIFSLIPTLAALQAQVAPKPQALPDDNPDEAKSAPAKEDRQISAEDKVIELSPFVVSAEDTQRYWASSTLAGTRIRTDLADIGSSISVVTKHFLDDTGSIDAQGLLVYTTNTEVGGTRGNFTGVGNAAALDENSKLVNPNANTRVRGLGAADTTRDYFASDIPWDSYNIGRIDLSRGANAVLFGVGSPAGIINASTLAAEFKDANKVVLTFGQYGSARGHFDLNKVIRARELAIRVEGLSDHSRFEQEPAHRNDKRLYAALRYDPEFMSDRGMPLSLKVNYEQGTINSNNPRMLPPIDKITPWFTAMNKGTYNAVAVYQPGGAQVAGSAAFQPWLATEGLFGGPQVIFPDPTSAVQSPATVYDSATNTYFGLDPKGVRDGGIGGLPGSNRLQMIGQYSQYAQRVGLPFSKTLNPYKNIYLRDTSVYDFYSYLLDGPNKHESQDFDVFSADLSQTYWENRLGLQAVWSQEHYNSMQITTLNNQDVAIGIDVNQVLIDGTPNPNVGRPFVNSRAVFGSSLFSSLRKSGRYTGFLDLKAGDFLRDTWLSRSLGHHLFTANYTSDQRDTESKGFQRFGMDPSYNALTGSTLLSEIGYLAYLGPSLTNAGTPAGAHLSNLKALQIPSATTIRYFNSNWNKPTSSTAPGYVDPGSAWVNPTTGAASTQSENPANYVGWANKSGVQVLSADNGAINQLTKSATKNRAELSSKVFVWQGFLFDGDLVPTWSVRKDTVRSYSKTAPTFTNGTADLNASTYALPTKPYATVEGTIHSLSGVLHTPKKLRGHLWGNSDIALLYSKSTNFQASAGRVDLYGQNVPNPTGTTKDYGVLLTTWGGKLSFKAMHYKSDTTNASITGLLAYYPGYMAYALNASAQRFKLGLSGGPQYSVGNAGYQFNFQPYPGQTDADARARQQAAVDAGLAGVPNDQFLKAWSIDATKASNWNQPTPNYIDIVVPSGLTATGATSSEGMEYEINFQPTKNWSVAVNASHDTAKVSSMATNWKEWVEKFQTLMNGPAGDLPLYLYGGVGYYGRTEASISLKGAWNNNFYAGYLLALATEGTNLPEIRPWRLNLVTNYDMNRYVKGLNVGGAFRFQDKVGIGYPVIKDPATNADTFDVSHPYYGPTDKHVDVWVGYSRKLNKDISWRIQLNVRNVAENHRLVPITAQPDGSPGGLRIAEGQYFQVTNTFSF